MSSVLKLALLKHNLQNSQFVFDLDPKTLLPIDFAAPVCGKSVSTFRVDVTRAPDRLPRLTRIGRRVFVRVADLLNFINPQQTEPAPAPVPAVRRPGRPARVEQFGRLGTLVN